MKPLVEQQTSWTEVFLIVFFHQKNEQKTATPTCTSFLHLYTVILRVCATHTHTTTKTHTTKHTQPKHTNKNTNTHPHTAHTHTLHIPTLTLHTTHTPHPHVRANMSGPERWCTVPDKCRSIMHYTSYLRTKGLHKTMATSTDMLEHNTMTNIDTGVHMISHNTQT